MNNSYKLTKKSTADAQKDTIWSEGNSVLYDLCKTHPKHKNENLVVAKFWLIGRSYAVAIERCATASNDDLYEKRIPRANLEEIDMILQKDLPTQEETAHWSSKDWIIASVKAHKKLVNLLIKELNLNKAPRSFASKYLHFHRPEIFLIYDSRAERAINKQYRINQAKKIDITDDQSRDLAYYRFCCKCLTLNNTIQKEYNIKLTTRQMDNLLLAVESKNQ